MNRAAFWLAWTAICLPLYGFWCYGLFDLDEGIYAASLAEMQARGDWIIPTLDGKPFLEKPILMYWGALAFDKVGVGGVLGLRLFSALCFLGLAFVVYRFIGRSRDPRTALFAAMAVGVCPLIAGIGRMFMPDAALLLFFSLALFAYWESLHHSSRWLWLSGAALGLAMLAKGPFAPVLFGAIVVTAWMFIPTARSASRSGWVGFAIAFLAIVCSWYVPIALNRGHEFFSEFIVRQNLARFAGGDEAHRGPFLFYVPVVILVMWPFLGSLVHAIRHPKKPPFEMFLWIWAGWVFVLFSVAGSKLPHYVAPMFVPLSILGSLYSGSLRSRDVWPSLALVAIGFAAVLLNADALESVEGLSLPLTTALGLGVAASVFGLLRATRFPYVGGMGLTAGVLILGLPAYWQGSHGDVRAVADFLSEAKPPRLIEFRMDGMGEQVATSHPSLRWYTRLSPLEATWPEDLVRSATPGAIILTRRDRLTAGDRTALEELGLPLVEVGKFGEFTLFRMGDHLPFSSEGHQ